MCQQCVQSVSFNVESEALLLTEPEFAASDLLGGEIHTDWDPGPTGRPGPARAGWRSVSAVCTAPKRPRVASTAPVPLRALPDTDEVGCSWPGTRRPRAALAPRLQRRHRWASAEAAAERSLVHERRRWRPSPDDLLAACGRAVRVRGERARIRGVRAGPASGAHLASSRATRRAVWPARGRGVAAN